MGIWHQRLAIMGKYIVTLFLYIDWMEISMFRDLLVDVFPGESCPESPSLDTIYR